MAGNTIVEVGERTTLWCESGSAPFTNAIFEWFLNNQRIPGAISQSYRTPKASKTDNGDKYSCKVSVKGVSSDRSKAVILQGMYIIQGGPKVGLQVFHYLFHFLDLIYFWGVVKNKVFEINPPHSG